MESRSFRPKTSKIIRYRGFDKSELRWYAVRTSFRHEKMAQRDLERKGLEAWLPLIRETRRYDRKRRVVELPLVSSYLFVHINENGYYPVLESPYVSGFVRFGDDILPVPMEELELIRRVVGETAKIKAENRLPMIGDQVEIIGGHLTGVRGVLEKHLNNNQVSISLQTLCVTLVLEVNPKYLRKI